MGMEFHDIIEDFDTVGEMSSDPAGMVTVPASIIEEVTAGDDDPRFATFVIESGWSKSKRFWGPELFSKVAAEMNAAAESEPLVGYLGHIKDEDDAYVFPEIQLQWVGAKLIQNTGDKAKLAVKAYVLPGTKGRDYLRRKLVKSVSWRGKIAQEMYQQGVRVKDFAIESIDLSRPRKAGMNARLVGALTSEMEQEEIVKPEEIAALQENELRAHNPGLVSVIEAAARKPVETKVSEMEATADEIKPTLELLPQLRSLLGLDDKADDVTVMQAAITTLKEEGKKLRETVMDSVLGKRFKDKDTGLLRRVLIGEMKSQDISLTGDMDKDEKTVGEMLDTIIDGDTELKTMVSEMEAAPPIVQHGSDRGRDGGKTTELKPGTETSRYRVRSVA